MQQRTPEIIPPYTTNPSEPITASGFCKNSLKLTIIYKILAPRNPPTAAIIARSMIASSFVPFVYALYSPRNKASINPIPIISP